MQISLARFDKDRKPITYEEESPPLSSSRRPFTTNSHPHSPLPPPIPPQNTRPNNPTKTYSQALQSILPPPISIEATVSPFINAWKHIAVITEALDFEKLCKLQQFLSLQNIKPSDVKYLGGLSVLILLHGTSQTKTFINQKKDLWSTWFASCKEWNGFNHPKNRIAWLELTGIPPHLWTKETISNIGNRFGRVITMPDISWEEKNMASIKIGILTNNPPSINHKIVLKDDTSSHISWISEFQSQWFPSFTSGYLVMADLDSPPPNRIHHQSPVNHQLPCTPVDASHQDSVAGGNDQPPSMAGENEQSPVIPPSPPTDTCMGNPKDKPVHSPMHSPSLSHNSPRTPQSNHSPSPNTFPDNPPNLPPSQQPLSSFSSAEPTHSTPNTSPITHHPINLSISSLQPLSSVPLSSNPNETIPSHAQPLSNSHASSTSHSESSSTSFSSGDLDLNLPPFSKRSKKNKKKSARSLSNLHTLPKNIFLRHINRKKISKPRPNPLSASVFHSLNLHSSPVCAASADTSNNFSPKPVDIDRQVAAISKAGALAGFQTEGYQSKLRAHICESNPDNISHK